MRKLTWLLGAMLLLLSLTGCGNKVDSESIRSYLESSYYNESDASVDKIKDISQEQGNNDKEFIVSCTVKASNRYAVQTANWVITFERFENSWVGTGREMTYYETELQNGMSEEEMKDLVDLEGLYWQKQRLPSRSKRPRRTQPKAMVGKSPTTPRRRNLSFPPRCLR